MAVQCLRLHFPVQRVWVQSLVGEPACLVAKKPKHKTEAIFVTNSLKTLKMVHIKKRKTLKNKSNWNEDN